MDDYDYGSSEEEYQADQFEYEFETVRANKSEDLKARYQGKIDLSTSTVSSQIVSSINGQTRRLDENRIR
jgi:hypothetical protein